MSIQHEPESGVGWKARHRALADDVVWMRRDMRIALAARDIGAFYRLLHGSACRNNASRRRPSSPKAKSRR